MNLSRRICAGLLALFLVTFSCFMAGCAQQTPPATQSALGASGTTDNPALRDFYQRVRPALVAVRYEWNGELAKQEVIGCGIVVRDDGLVMIPMTLVSTVIPDAQMQDFKIIIPSDSGDETEVDATFMGRDERSDVAFVLAKPQAAAATQPDTQPGAQADAPAPRKWTAIHFVDEPLTVGQTFYGVGILPKSAGYKAYIAQAVVAAQLRGEVPQVMVAGGLANVGSPVFDANFNAIGFVEPQEGEDILLDSRNQLNDVLVPPHFFVPTAFFAQSLADPPTVERPVKMAWMGVPQMTGVNEQFAEFLGLKNQPAVQIGDTVPGAPAALAGLQPGSIIVAMNGKPLQRGDLPEELPMILRRNLLRMPPGTAVDFTVLPDKGAQTKEVTVTLADRPRQPNQAERFHAQDLGFVGARRCSLTITRTR